MFTAQGTMITALAWVGRGYAKAQLESYEPSSKELKAGQKLAAKIGQGDKEIGQAVKEAEAKMDQLMDQMDSENSDSDDHVPTFTPELAMLKGEKVYAEAGSDNSMNSDDD